MRTKTLPFLSISSSSQEPRAGIRFADEDLLLGVLGLHQVGARRADELRDDDALGAVDDERAALGHPREVAHEDRLLADLARLAVDEADRDGQRPRVGEVLLAALLQGRDGLVEGELAELHGEVARVVLDRGDVVDGLSQAPLLGVDEPGEGLLLDLDQVRDFEHLFEAREGTARTESIGGSQDGDSSGTGERARGGAPPAALSTWVRWEAQSATSQDSTGAGGPLCGAVGAHGPRPALAPYVAGAGAVDGCDYRPTCTSVSARATPGLSVDEKRAALPDGPLCR